VAGGGASSVGHAYPSGRRSFVASTRPRSSPGARRWLRACRFAGAHLPDGGRANRRARSHLGLHRPVELPPVLPTVRI